MNEAETRAEYIEPKLVASGWGVVEGSRILREHYITAGKIQAGSRGKAEIADFVLVYRNQKLAVIEAKQVNLGPTEGVTQAKSYADKLLTPYAFSTNGKEIYQISMKNGREEFVSGFPNPVDLWNWIYSDHNEWMEKFDSVPFEDGGGQKKARYYQENAVNNALKAVAEGKNRVLLTLATGTGKTFIAFQIVWKLFHSRWNLQKDGGRRPRILFLADRNILADQAFNSFSAFDENALIRINPLDIRKKGCVPTNGSIFFTIFQTFMTGKANAPYFGEYPKDFFDFIIVDECHRGGANDESNWRSILDYFSPAVQLGLTATPKRDINSDTYKYFGDPVYVYSLKQGINDGFLTPFKVKRVKTTLDDYVYTSDDEIIEGEVEEGRLYKEDDFNRIIEIREREEARVKILLESINQNEKTIVFCATQEHAAAVRDLINQNSKSKDPFYCVRVTANDGFKGEQYLRDFQDNEKYIPTILTTSQKLSTGVDARNIRNIVLMRPVNSMIEFKQIIGRGTRLFDGKEYFTIIDFVDAYHHFSDPEWDGEPAGQVTDVNEEEKTYKLRANETNLTLHDPELDEETKRKKIIIKLRDGKEREIQHMVSTSFWDASGKPISNEEFIQKMYGELPFYFKSKEELQRLWSNPASRKAFMDKISENGCSRKQLESLQKLISAEQSDFYDVFAYISFNTTPISRVNRAETAKEKIFDSLTKSQRDFSKFVLSKYIENGVDELAEEKLPALLNIKYETVEDAIEKLGDIDLIRNLFFKLQRNLYATRNNI